MTNENDKEPRLAARRTFILQLQSGCQAKEGELSGRVEHLTSGDSEPFGSLAALLDFLARFEGDEGREGR